MALKEKLKENLVYKDWTILKMTKQSNNLFKKILNRGEKNGNANNSSSKSTD